MTIDGELSLEEAKTVAVQKGAAPVGKVVAALDALYVELRRLENERDAHLSR